HTFERRERTTKYMIEPSKLVRPLDHQDIIRLFDHANNGAIAPGIAADRARIVLRDIRADAARMYAQLQIRNGFGERGNVFSRLLEQIECEPLRGLAADCRQTREAFDQRFE